MLATAEETATTADANMEIHIHKKAARPGYCTAPMIISAAKKTKTNRIHAVGLP